MKVKDYAVHCAGLDFVVGDAVGEVQANGSATRLVSEGECKVEWNGSDWGLLVVYSPDVWEVLW